MISTHQRSSAFISAHQRSSAFIRADQHSSAFISTHQRSSALMSVHPRSIRSSVAPPPSRSGFVPPCRSATGGRDSIWLPSCGPTWQVIKGNQRQSTPLTGNQCHSEVTSGNHRVFLPIPTHSYSCPPIPTHSHSFPLDAPRAAHNLRFLTRERQQRHRQLLDRVRRRRAHSCSVRMRIKPS